MKKVLFACLLLACGCSADSDTFKLYVGTYGEKAYQFVYNSRDLDVVLKHTYKVENSSYIAVSEVIHNLYALTEKGAYSAVSAFDPNGNLINSQPLPNADPCYLIKYQNNIITANYSSGSISILPIDPRTGAVLPPSQEVILKGSGPVENRQKSSHIHTVTIIETEAGPFLLASDLGSDKVYIFSITEKAGGLELVPNQAQREIVFPAGSGPRHIAVSPDKDTFYVLCELSGMIISFKYDYMLRCRLFQAIPSDRSGAQASADIHIHPNGKFLYSSTRKIDDGLEAFEINDETELLEPIGHVPTLQHPRNFSFTPDGKQLLVASKNECAIQIFKVNRITGELSDTHERIRLNADQPVCLVIK